MTFGVAGGSRGVRHALDSLVGSSQGEEGGQDALVQPVGQAEIARKACEQERRFVNVYGCLGLPFDGCATQGDLAMHLSAGPLDPYRGGATKGAGQGLGRVLHDTTSRGPVRKA